MHIPNIEKALGIEVTKCGNEFRADAKNLPGTPLVGIGQTELQAKYNLLVNWLYMFARYYTKPEFERHGGDYNFIPIILKLLKEDMDKIYD